MPDKPIPVQEYAQLTSQLINLNIPAEYSAGVIGNLERLFELTAPLQAFELDSDEEIAQVFSP